MRFKDPPLTSGSPVPMLASDIAATLKVEWRPTQRATESDAIVGAQRLCVHHEVVRDDSWWSWGVLGEFNAYEVDAAGKTINGRAATESDAKRAAVLALAQHLHSQLVAAEGVMGSAAGAEAAEKGCAARDCRAVSGLLKHAYCPDCKPVAPPASGWHSICGGCGAKDPHPCRPGCLYGEPVAPPPALEEPKWERNAAGTWFVPGPNGIDLMGVEERSDGRFSPYAQANSALWDGHGIIFSNVDDAKAAALAAWRALQEVKA